MAKRTIFNPDTNEEEQIELPTNSVVEQALIDFEYPASGIQSKDIADRLANQFDLTDKQRNSRHKSGYFVWSTYVNDVANRLVKSEKILKIKRGWFAKIDSPDLESADSEESQSAEAPEAAIERNYRMIRKQLGAELLQKIKGNSPEFFENLVLDVLVALGYGGSLEDAEAEGGSGDGGIDGIIKQDKLGLDNVYVQAKRWDSNIAPNLVREFSGALDDKGARKGIFITTAEFSKKARQYAQNLKPKRIVLIGGNQLVQLMIDNDVGVEKHKSYEIKQIDLDYFAANDDG